MAKKTKNQLQDKFQTGDTPEQQDYFDLFDSFVHNDEARKNYQFDRTGSSFLSADPIASANLSFPPGEVVFGIPTATVYFAAHIAGYYFDVNTDQWVFIAAVAVGSGGGGDMLKTTYDPNNDGIIDRAASVNGVSAAGSNTYYGKNGAGAVGFHSLPTGAGASVFTYQDGEAFIRSMGGASGDVTYSRTNDVATITIPSGVTLLYARINAATSDMNGESDFTVKVIDNSGVANQDVNTFMPPLTEFIKRDNSANDPPTSAFPFVYSKDTNPIVQVQIVDYGTNSIDMKFKNVTNYTEWSVIIKY